MKNLAKGKQKVSIKVNISNQQNAVSLLNGWRTLIRKACVTTLKCEKFTEDCEINVTFVDDEMIHQINKEFRNIDKSTDVLSFPLYDEETGYEYNPENSLITLGDVIISVQHALLQADLYGHSVERELAYLTVHSVLHILGYDHVDNEEERKVMREHEEIVLKKMGLNIVKEK